VIKTIVNKSTAELIELVHLKHGSDPGRQGWGVRMRLRFGYFTPDEVYEATISRLVNSGCAWLDVGCGRNIFPGNPSMARILADRCAVLVGVDPDQTLEDNPFVHQRVKSSIVDFCSDRTFDLVTLRMVAEHIADPEATVEALARLTSPGGRVVIYTVNRWAPVSIASKFIPFRLHHPIKRWLWKTEEKDTFPVAYRMNTRRRLCRLFEGQGFRELGFAYLDDCRTFGNFQALFFLELSARCGLKTLRLKYPENCLLGVYERSHQL
jgi:SAM-dependent methyltransferase